MEIQNDGIMEGHGKSIPIMCVHPVEKLTIYHQLQVKTIRNISKAKDQNIKFDENVNIFFLSLVCVEVLRPSQPNGVMSSAVSLPNHTFTGQA